ncbi:hypothetical protein [Streptomyces sp. BP-8]|uniref:hypothetical protein n=1 Tax=Streptomyces sirii TaxID=3127701 RepID=UPI00388DB0F4
MNATAPPLSEARILKEACRVRAAGIKNYFDSRAGKGKGTRLDWPKWRKRKHGCRFCYDAGRAKPLDARTVRLLPSGTWPRVRACPGSLTAWPPGRHILGATIREQAGRWWISFQVERHRRRPNIAEHPLLHLLESGVPCAWGSRGGRPPALDRETYKQLNAVERCINRLEQWRGIATRYEKTATIYLAGLHIAGNFLWSAR